MWRVWTVIYKMCQLHILLQPHSFICHFHFLPVFLSCLFAVVECLDDCFVGVTPTAVKGEFHRKTTANKYDRKEEKER